MENASNLLRNLEETSHGLGRTFSGAGLNGYMASAVFVASSESPGSVFAVTHAGGSPQHHARTDKHVYLRRFTSSDSVAAQVFEEHEASMYASRMFPKEHLCINIPMIPKHSSDQDLYARGMLQVVFGPDSGASLKDVKAHIDAQPTYQAMSGILTPLLHGVDGGRDAFFKVRDPYQANAVVMLFDISDFSGHSRRLGHYRAQDFADKFCQDFMKPITEEYGANLLRYEGDGLWIEMPIDQYASDRERQEQMKNAVDMARDAIGEYSSFAADQDYGFADSKLKVSMELGEVRDYFWNRNQVLTNKPNDRSGPVFSHIRDANDRVAWRDKHDIVLGPELRAELGGESIHDISPDAFEHY